MPAPLDVGGCPSMYMDYENDREAKLGEMRLVGALDVKGAFADGAFAASGSSLYFNPAQPPRFAMPGHLVDWNRISRLEIAGCTSPVVLDEKQPALAQGALRDRWFLCALSMIATRPDLLKRVLVSTEHAGRGLYTCKFFKGGRWRYVHVDDRIPCNRSGGPHFARSPNEHETWCMIVEKAYAKLHGTYEAIVEGALDESLHDVTGLPTEVFRLDDPRVAAKVHDYTFWDELIELQEAGSLIGVYDTSEDLSKLDPFSSERANGLVKNHTYTVLDLKMVSADATVENDALDAWMIKLSNNWELGEWTGPWCKNSPLWGVYEPIAEACSRSDGAFWIEWTDFVRCFDTIVVAHNFEAGSRQQYRGTWVPGDTLSGAGGPPSSETWRTNPQYCVDVPVTTRFCATLSRSDPRWHPRAALSSIGLSILSTDTGRRQSHYRSENVCGGTPGYAAQRTVTVMCELEPGAYTVVPSCAEALGSCFLLELIAKKDDLRFLQEDDEMLRLDWDDENDTPLLDEDNIAAEAASLCSNPTPILEEPDARELPFLWEQAASLATFLKELDQSNTLLAERITALELSSQPVVPADQTNNADDRAAATTPNTPARVARATAAAA